MGSVVILGLVCIGAMVILGVEAMYRVSVILEVGRYRVCCNIGVS